MLNHPFVKLGITAAVLYALYRWAPNNEVRGMAIGALGVVALNQIPVVRDGMSVRVINGAAA